MARKPSKKKLDTGSVTTLVPLLSTAAVAAPDPVALAILSMRESVEAADAAYRLLQTQEEDPAASMSDQQDILRQMGAVHDEWLQQSLLLNEVESAGAVVQPPTANSGTDLSNALATLQKMRQATDNVVKLLSLAGQLITSLTQHRQEVAGRKS